jgi:hypothetical protein
MVVQPQPDRISAADLAEPVITKITTERTIPESIIYP